MRYYRAMSSDEGFGPTGSDSGEAPPFVVAGPSTVAVDLSRSTAGSFTVSNVTGRPVRARVLVLAGAGADASWFHISGDPERTLPIAGTTTVDVVVQVPKNAPPGAFSFALGAALEESPEQIVSGPTVTSHIPASEKRKFPWWIVVVSAVAVLAVVAGGLLIWNLTRPEPAPISSAPSTLVDETLEISVIDATVDLETLAILSDADSSDVAGGDIYLVDSDVLTSGLNGPGPLIVRSLNSGIVVVPDDSFETCAAAMRPGDGDVAPTKLELADVPHPTFACLVTGDDHLAVLEIGTVESGDSGGNTRLVGVTVWGTSS